MILWDNLGSVIFPSCQLLFYCNNALDADIQAIRIRISMMDASIDKSPNDQLVQEIKRHAAEGI